MKTETNENMEALISFAEMVHRGTSYTLEAGNTEAATALANRLIAVMNEHGYGLTHGEHQVAVAEFVAQVLMRLADTMQGMAQADADKLQMGVMTQLVATILPQNREMEANDA